uniref:Uncharacterized protein n=1 Tax=Oryza punctata TaxID=4537 RepID=A0A0E0LK90_ORYPU
MMKMGISVEFGICKGKRKNGMGCTIAINNFQEAVKYLSGYGINKILICTNADIKLISVCLGGLCSEVLTEISTGRVELKGGNFKFSSKLRPERDLHGQSSPRTIQSKKSNTTSKSDVNRWVKKGFE